MLPAKLQNNKQIQILVAYKKTLFHKLGLSDSYGLAELVSSG